MRVFVVEGCGDWVTKQYFQAFKALASSDVGVIFTYDSTFGLDLGAERLPATLFLEYLQNTLNNVKTIEEAGFACVDVKDTSFKLQGRTYGGRERLPKRVEAVFIATPDTTHCDVAQFWLGRARRIFVEKPFDASSDRIRRLRAAITETKSPTEVYGIDHYFVRCDQVARDKAYFMDRLLTASGGSAMGDITGFEFHMTEPPAKNEGDVRKRALSLQQGMIFDMASHALPVLSPFIDLNRPFEVTEAWAGVSRPMQEILFSGAESFFVATVRAYTQSSAHKSPRLIHGTIAIGKDIGSKPEKHLIIESNKGKMIFDLANYVIEHEPNGSAAEPVAPLHDNWARFFVKEVLADRLPKAVEVFTPQGAERIVRLLEEWRGLCRNAASDRLAVHEKGADLAALRTARFRVK